MKIRYALLLLLILLAVVGCNDSGGEFKGVGVTSGSSEKVISESGRSLSISGDDKTSIRVTGSNNSIKVTTKVRELIVSGNDNFITYRKGTRLTNTGRGNVITTEENNGSPIIPL